MTTQEFPRLMMGLLTGAGIAGAIYLSGSRRRTGAVSAPSIGGGPLFLPLILAVDLGMGILFGLAGEAAGLFLQVVFQTWLYYAALLIFLPLLRRMLRASTVAVLWLLPNVLYFNCYTYMRPAQPAVILPVPLLFVRWLPPVWILGFLAVMGRAVAGHLVYRRKLLRAASSVTDPEILSLWQREKSALGLENSALPLVRSAATATPLSIGIWQRTTRVVLPERTYTPEELRLVFRHELIHICRRDAATKLFLTLCQAVGWFNPLMWIAMRKCADDLELSCDELALRDADGDTREAYARLVLRTAGEERGFTTCLSVRARSLRYRLRGIVAGRRKLAGGLLAGALAAALMLTCGYVALASSPTSGEDALFHGRSAAYRVQEIYSLPDPQWYPLREQYYRCADGAALTEYLADLTLYPFNGFYQPDEKDSPFHISLDDGQRTLSVTLHDRFLTVLDADGAGSPRTAWYYLRNPDRAYLSALLTPEG